MTVPKEGYSIATGVVVGSRVEFAHVEVGYGMPVEWSLNPRLYNFIMLTKIGDNPDAVLAVLRSIFPADPLVAAELMVTKLPTRLPLPNTADLVAIMRTLQAAGAEVVVGPVGLWINAPIVTAPPLAGDAFPVVRGGVPVSPGGMYGPAPRGAVYNAILAKDSDPAPLPVVDAAMAEAVARRKAVLARIAARRAESADLDQYIQDKLREALAGAPSTVAAAPTPTAGWPVAGWPDATADRPSSMIPPR